MSMISDRLSALLQNLDHMSAEGQQDAFVGEVLENFGDPPPAGDHAALWELKLHGITARAKTQEDAINDWKRLAVQQRAPEEDIEDDGFVTVHLTHQPLAFGGRGS